MLNEMRRKGIALKAKVKVHIEVMLDMCIFRGNKEYKNLSVEQFNKIKEISKRAFPDGLQLWRDMLTIGDLYDELAVFDNSQVKYLVHDDWYIIGVNHVLYFEIIDLAGIIDSYKKIAEVINWIKEVSEGKELRFNARKGTSYKFMYILSRQFHAKIIEETPCRIADEDFYYVRMKRCSCSKKK